MNDFMETFLAITLVIGIYGFTFFFGYYYSQKVQCENRGNVYSMDFNKCMDMKDEYVLKKKVKSER